MTTEIVPTTKEVVTAIAGIEGTQETIDAVVMELSPELIPVWLAQTAEIVSLVNRWKKALTLRMVVEERFGERVELGGKSFVFEEGRKSEFEKIGDLFYLLNRLGVSVTALGESVTGVRITDLEAIAASLPEDVRQDALDAIKEHRVWKPVTASLIDEKSPYRRSKKGAT